MITREEFEKTLPDGWKVELWKATDKDASEWYYELTDSDVIEIVKEIKTGKNKGCNVLAVVPYGDIGIDDQSGKTEGFRFRGVGRVHGELTEDLMRNGDWRNNNWFTTEYVRDRKFRGADEDVSYTITDACMGLVDAAQRIDEGKHPFKHAF